MIVDAELDRSAFARAFDVCIVGAGPAGITLARRLAAGGAEVALMEAGGLAFSDRSQALYRGANVGLDYHALDIARLRFLGGSSNHWGGWCRALDHHDFLPKPWNPDSGWPIGQTDLDPYRADADRILDIPSATAWPDRPLEQADHRFENVRFRWSPPTLFGEKYRDELAASDRIRVALNANLVDLRLDEPQHAVTAAHFRGYRPDDPGWPVRARHFCLCTGGIENARLLLNFRSQAPAGIGNRHDLVGRYFSDHPHFVVGDLLLRVPLYWHVYAPTWRFVLEHEVLNFGLRLEPDDPPSGMFAALANDPPPPRFRIDPSRRPPDPMVVPPRLARVLGDARLTGPVRIACEQALNADSRVAVGADHDALGLRRAVLDWRLSDLDVHTMRTAVLALGAHLAEQDIGRVRMRDWLLADPVRFPGVDADIVGGMHHMGTTRMADDPRHGVVDRDCRVHGLDNLFVGGSSVFATPGHANPTYTIVQLALRLADHLVGRLRS
jgi:hypothetical protein